MLYSFANHLIFPKMRRKRRSTVGCNPPRGAKLRHNFLVEKADDRVGFGISKGFGERGFGKIINCNDHVNLTRGLIRQRADVGYSPLLEGFVWYRDGMEYILEFTARHVPSDHSTRIAPGFLQLFLRHLRDL